MTLDSEDLLLCSALASPALGQGCWLVAAGELRLLLVLPLGLVLASVPRPQFTLLSAHRSADWGNPTAN